MKRILSILCFTLMTVCVFASSKTDADALYGKEQYEKAAAKYEKILAREGVSAAIYYNLGNCYYKLDEIPLAILNYERALVLSPGDGDIRANLALARGKTQDKVTPPSELFFVTWWYDLVHIQSVSSWAVYSAVAFVLSLVLLLVFFLSADIRLRKVGFYSSLCMFAFCLFGNIAAFSLYSEGANHAGAILMAPVVTVKSSPSESSTDLFLIHEGARLEILDASMKDWYEVKFEEGKQGWVPAASLEKI